MQQLRAAALCAAAFMAFCAPAFAQIQSTPVPITAKPNFSQMQFLTGTWNCSVMSARRPSAYHTTSTASIEPNGYWLVTRTVTHRASWISQEIAGTDRITYDPSTSRWIDIMTDDTGGYDVTTSPGWNGRTITWTDRIYPKTNNTATLYPTTVRKISDTRTVATSSFREPGGRLVMVRTTCTKG